MPLWHRYWHTEWAGSDAFKKRDAQVEEGKTPLGKQARSGRKKPGPSGSDNAQRKEERKTR